MIPRLPHWNCHFPHPRVSFFGGMFQLRNPTHPKNLLIFAHYYSIPCSVVTSRSLSYTFLLFPRPIPGVGAFQRLGRCKPLLSPSQIPDFCPFPATAGVENSRLGGSGALEPFQRTLDCFPSRESFPRSRLSPGAVSGFTFSLTRSCPPIPRLSRIPEG